jgi:hypothetical protein
MKKLTPLLAILALALPAAHSTEPFEGKVTMKISGPDQADHEISYTIKGSRVLITMGAMGSVIMDRERNEITMLMPQQRMYMVQPIPQPPPDSQAPTGAPDDVSMQVTGVTDKILGYACTKYLLKSKKSTTELWLTDQLGSFAGFGPGAGGGPMGGAGRGRAAAPQAWEEALRGKNFFPMRIVAVAANGTESFRLEVTSIDRQAVDDSDLAPPADWKKLDVGAMMGGFGPH